MCLIARSRVLNELRAGLLHLDLIERVHEQLRLVLIADRELHFVARIT